MGLEAHNLLATTGLAPLLVAACVFACCRGPKPPAPKDDGDDDEDEEGTGAAATQLERNRPQGMLGGSGDQEQAQGGLLDMVSRAAVGALAKIRRMGLGAAA